MAVKNPNDIPHRSINDPANADSSNRKLVTAPSTGTRAARKEFGFRRSSPPSSYPLTSRAPKCPCTNGTASCFSTLRSTYRSTEIADSSNGHAWNASDTIRMRGGCEPLPQCKAKRGLAGARTSRVCRGGRESQVEKSIWGIRAVGTWNMKEGVARHAQRQGMLGRLFLQVRFQMGPTYFFSAAEVFLCDQTDQPR